MTTAQILTFSSSKKRGRPKKNLPATDTGTPETVMKRLLGATSEALDLCLQRGIISEKQHWCGIHLRWLYTLRHGVPSVRAVDLTKPINETDNSIDYEDPVWREAREREYSNAINILSKTGHAVPVMNLCIFNERPKFLNISLHNPVKTIKLNEKDMDILREGLDILIKIWKKK